MSNVSIYILKYSKQKYGPPIIRAVGTNPPEIPLMKSPKPEYVPVVKNIPIEQARELIGTLEQELRDVENQEKENS